MTSRTRPLLAKLKVVSDEVEAAWQMAEDQLPEVDDDARDGLLRLLRDLDVIQRAARGLAGTIQDAELMSDRQYDEFYAKTEEIKRIFDSKMPG